MEKNTDTNKKTQDGTTNYKDYLVDLIIYISALFLARQIYIPQIGYIASVILGSLIAFSVATWRMRVRGIKWKDLGLCKPKNFWITLLTAGLIIITVICFIIVFEIIKDNFPLNLREHKSSGVSRFGDLKGNIPLFLSIILFVWVESMLEELIDRGFMLNWFEKLLSFTSVRTILAVVIQAVLFGFRHSYDLSERSITVGMIGLVMGIAYVISGRNLWALIIAHCILNSFSMLERVF
ncbi:CPBP family intramembrane glutamic endopeptidase [Aquimarina sp. 2201CG5-10]|uniref:CPBP family intramembrane glutamic endopeptidase n=1 Tax=Aquimarina callyspongiae TaxID=3098150 RepID=UPI002AB4DDE5|nr:CPBP family intramembrane glutamic endopeptidase [Aquimarina sp. 2201CG5-10]MDY8134335.1 CPBP family intramembrane glutamic endopeptidase [Aquimarina sp. 2201CG5-10]